MAYTSDTGFGEYVGLGASALTERYGADLARQLANVERRMLAYIMPNEPIGEDETAAFTTAVFEQYLYEREGAGKQMADMPAGIRSFSVNGFSAKLGGATGAEFPSGVSPDARAALLTAGLLFKGVDCRC